MMQGKGQGSVTSASASKGAGQGVVQHHEIGQVGKFLKSFGKSKDEATKSLLASSLQIIGLEDVKERYADQWEKLEKRVDQAVEAFFTKKLGKRDMFIRMAKNRFALLFANTSYEEGLERASTLASELLQLLFGELPDHDNVSIETVVLDADLVEHMSEFDDIADMIEYLNLAISDTEEEQGEASDEKEDHSVLFRSMINCNKNMVSVSELLPCSIQNGKRDRIRRDELAEMQGSRMRADVDYQLISEAEGAVNGLGGLGKKPLILASVDYDTLANSYRRHEYARILKRLPKYTQKHFLINVTSVPAGLLNSRIRQILTTLKPLALGFIFEVGPDWDEFDVVRDLPVYGVSFFGDREEDLMWIEPLVERAKVNNARTFWRGVSSDDLARRAFEMRVDFLSGDVIGRVQETPVSPFSLKSNRIR
ncbi:MAG: hypothetical protein JJ879_07650 [Sneathiella sp.]|nr:hypothetical protein [Sneathiella sp.]